MKILSSKPTREDMLSLILTVVARQGASYAMADYTTRHRDHPFLKKSPIGLERDTSDTTLKIAKGLEGPGGKVVLEENRDLRRTKGARLDAPEAG